MTTQSKKVPAILLKIDQMRDSSLTKSEQRVVDTILAAPQDVIYASIAELAKKSKVSDPTIVRTCKKLGLEGYQDLKITLAQELVSPLESISEKILPDDNTQTVCDKIFQSTIQTLNFTHDTLNTSDVEKSAELINHAHKIIIVGMGNSDAICMDFQHKLMRLGLNARALSDPHLAAMAIAYMDTDDVLFCISHSGSSKEIVELAAQAKKQNTKIISLTNVGLTPLSKHSTITLHTSSLETKYKILGLNSRIAQLAIIDTLYTLLAMKSNSNQSLNVEKAMQSHKY